MINGDLEDEKVQRERKYKLYSLWYYLFSQYGGQIEIEEEGVPTTIYFPRPPYKEFLSEELTTAFFEKIKRDSQKTRVEGLMDNAPSILNSIKTDHKISQAIDYIPIFNLIYRYVDWLKPVCVILVFFHLNDFHRH